jgi:PAS domain S-box-containing protein
MLAKVQRQLRDHGVTLTDTRTADQNIIAAARGDFRDRAQIREPHKPLQPVNSISSTTVQPHDSQIRQLHSTQPSVIPAATEPVLAALGVGTFEYDPIAGTYRLSDQCKVILGLRIDDEPHTDRIVDLMHPDDRHLTAVLCDSLRADGPGHYSIEHRVIRPDGALRWVQVSGQTVFQETASGRRAIRSHGAMLDITERGHTERNLYERDSQLSAFIERAPVSIAMFDQDMRYLAVSNQYAGQIGFSPAELIGHCAYEVFPDHPERWIAAHKRCLGGASERCDVDFVVRPDGSGHWVSWDIRPWYRADQTVGGLILFTENITERIHARKQLRESEARLELAIRAGALGIYDYNLAESTTTWDARVRELWGVGPDEEITYETFLAGLHPDDRAPTVKALEESLSPQSNRTHAAEYRVVHREDGATRWVSSIGTVFFEGERAVRLVGTVQDITDRKKAEQALVESEERLRQVAMVYNIGVFDHDHISDTVYWSPELREYLERSPSETAGPKALRQMIHPEDLERVAAADRQAHDLAGDGRCAVQYRIVTHNGSLKWLDTRSKTFFAGELGARYPRRTVGAMVDITARMEAEEALRGSVREKETLLREVHHRVKNNLQIISSVLHFQAKKVKNPEDLVVFNESRNRLRAMILVHEKLYKSPGLARIECGTYIQALVQDLWRSYATIVSRRISLHVDADRIELPIESALPCGMIVCELLTNSIKYAFPGQHRGEVRLALTAAAERVTLSVCDNGIGLPVDFDVTHATTFGWQLISNLAAQLDATLTATGGNAGTQVTLHFRSEHAHSR